MNLSLSFTRAKLFIVAKKQMLTGFSIYLLASVTNKAIPFFLLPILTRYLSPEQYGVIALYQVIILFSLPVVGMNMQLNITRNFFRQNQKEIAGLMSNLLFILGFSTTLVLLLLSVMGLFLYSLFDIPPAWLYTVPIISAMNMLNQFNLTILRNQNRPILYGSFEIANTALDVLVTVVLVVVYNFGWEGRATGILTASIVFGIISLVRIYRSGFLTFGLVKERLKEIWNVSLPLVPHILSVAVIDMSDRFFIRGLVGQEAVGIYNVGYQFGLIMSLFTDSFSKAWSPWIYEQLANVTVDKKYKIVKATYFYYVGIVVLAVFVTVAARFLIRTMTTEAYYGAQEFVIWVALGYAVRGMYTMVFYYLVHEGKTRFLGYITVLSALTNLMATYTLIKLNGTVGAAQATFISYGVQFLVVWWYANKIYPMPWRLQRDLVPLSNR